MLGGEDSISTSSSSISVPSPSTSNCESAAEHSDDGLPSRFTHSRQNSMTSQRRRQLSQLAHRLEHACSTSSTDTDPTAVVDDEEEEEEVTTPSGGAEAITSSGASYASSEDFTSSTNSNERASLRRCGRAMTDPDSLSDESGYHDDGHQRLRERREAEGKEPESDEDDGLRKLPEEKCADRVRHMLNGAESVTAL
ncbi:hypothetical protein AAVH_19901 [Aphelenchoides avenae]|nr:hypothetical protein AAVH_19901 [Aphelenchus avenae]